MNEQLTLQSTQHEETKTVPLRRRKACLAGAFALFAACALVLLIPHPAYNLIVVSVPPPFDYDTKATVHFAELRESAILNSRFAKRKRPPVKAPKAAREQDGSVWKSLVYVTLYIRFPNLATRRAALAGEH